MKHLAYGQCVIDIETSVIPHVSDFLGHIKVPANYKKQESIDKYLKDAQESESDRAALDPDLLRIATLTWWDIGEPAPLGYVARNEDEERKMLRAFAKRLQHAGGGTRDIVGFNILDFDLPAILRRAQYLDVPFPLISINRYRHNGVTDILQELTFDGKLKYRSLDFYCRRFKIDMPENPCQGKDVPMLIAAGKYDVVLAHNKADVIKTRRLAARLGHCLPEVQSPAA